MRPGRNGREKIDHRGKGKTRTRKIKRRRSEYRGPFSRDPGKVASRGPGEARRRHGERGIGRQRGNQAPPRGGYLLNKKARRK